MLDNFCETDAIMQTDYLDDDLNKNPFSNTEMTFSTGKDVQIEEAKEDEPLLNDLGFLNENSKFDGINLDDDIEKVEVTSRESYEQENEGDQITTTPKEEDQPFFNSIPLQNPNESIKNWLQRITEMQNDVQKKTNSTTGATSNHFQSVLLNSVTNTNTSLTSPSVINSSSSVSLNPTRVVKYQDLPYMGEMTLDNSKPRRGRKPKKADICHLIYKNYGTIFPGTPNPSSYLEKNSSILKKPLSMETKEIQDNIHRTDVQNRIISSLLEKRLTQEFNKNSEGIKKSLKTKTDEPLNLCIRDLNHLKIRLLKNNDNTYTSEIKSEPLSDDEVEFVHETPSPLVIPKCEGNFLPATPDSASTDSPDPFKTADGAAPGGYVYWPNAGVFIHPVALQQHLMMYQRMTNNQNYVLPNSNGSKLSQEAGSVTPVSVSDSHSAEIRKLAPKSNQKPKINTVRAGIDESNIQSVAVKDVKKRNSPFSETGKNPTKRKRSAIFIPPIPTESNTNPATEVSICKFKFTGGAKPSLQEKKMLSVDSGGNFRYYSGTGDKSMRGYEFFPRETLQQQISNTQGSSTGAFLQASGEKIYPTPPLNFTSDKASSEFLMSPKLPPSNFGATNPNPDLNSQRLKKRKSRKSLQREKLEQTFKEKGFLIQTQQTESAEGATYCKFRQLRKFTRYLFRSWKDYLPGNLAEGEQNLVPKLESSEFNLNEMSRDNGDTLSVHSVDLSTNNTND